MNYKRMISNVRIAFVAQGVSLILSILQSLLVPKMMGETQYGYWQLFIFYQSYVGLAHLGLNDGVYLINGGRSREEIDKRSIHSQYIFGLLFQLIIAAAIVLIAAFGGFGPDREFVITCTGVFLVIQNSSSFFMYLLQAINETKRSSYATIIERLVFLVPLILLLVVRYDSYRFFILSYIFSGIIQLAYCLWSCRDFISAGIAPCRLTVCQSLASIRVGCKLVIANLASQLILGVARFAIDFVWGIQTFGQLSFALSMAGFFLAFVSQASMVLFPFLRQANIDEATRFFTDARDAMTLLFPVIYIFYFPLVWLLSLWLPKYADSFLYFAFIIPICVFDSKMNICCTTFFKVLREENCLLRINIATCLMSSIFTLIGVLVFRSVFFIVGGVVVSVICRSLWSEHYLSHRLKSPSSFGPTLGNIALTLVFSICSFALPSQFALFVFCIAYTVFLFAYRKKVACLFRKISRVVH